MRIYLVENHLDTLECMCRHLRQAGHEVDTAQTIEQTLQELPGKERDVLITDLGLPDGDGCTLLERLGFARPPFAIAMSGLNRPSDRARIFAAGFQGYLTKPFLPSDLDAALELVQTDFRPNLR